jgi:hypothetical protein
MQFDTRTSRRLPLEHSAYTVAALTRRTFAASRTVRSLGGGPGWSSELRSKGVANGFRESVAGCDGWNDRPPGIRMVTTDWDALVRLD